MSVSMGLRNRVTGAYRYVPVATAWGFLDEWLPLCRRYGLSHVAEFSGGALCPVPLELIPEIVRELGVLAEAVIAEPGHEWMAERIAEILKAFAETDPAEWEYDFG
ncbi:Uncharacterized protein OS=Calothrix sp. PCC 6303 GN=Cal6303_2680 PE=4 SV=1 [Gemmataceae bacterium]|nr:Uncharacterized protein OS=Calothrix sp. PCC 6303 GN=Cal6303_2680 PE=4 SV=1 [Gemmataceae bacterium]VTT97707.1 Uncharacterized protein OS=Calothrix sp. PCC 6303 GN=Cal6303_2680 PE=4 SV=1 [Gemmataceae bacterium]